MNTFSLASNFLLPVDETGPVPVSVQGGLRNRNPMTRVDTRRLAVRKPMIGVIGSSSCSPEVARLAEEVGKGIARRGGVLICGGLGGVMEAACRGAKSEGGSTIGILPGSSRDDANQWVDIPIVTGMGVVRNTIIVSSSQAIISVSGGYGTLSEIGFSLNLGVPIVGLLTWEIDAPIIRAETPEEAVELAFQAVEKHA